MFLYNNLITGVAVDKTSVIFEKLTRVFCKHVSTKLLDHYIVNRLYVNGIHKNRHLFSVEVKVIHWSLHNSEAGLFTFRELTFVNGVIALFLF